MNISDLETLVVSTQLTTMKPVHALVKAAALFVAGLLSTFIFSQAKAEEVLIFYNNDPAVAISLHDGALITHNAKLLAAHISAINPNLNVQLVPVGSLNEVAEVLASATDKTRGVIFVGHGNERVYALNNRSLATGSEMADLMGHLPADKISDRMTYYFLGCEMGKPSNVKLNFQQEFNNRLMETVPQSKRAGIDVIAHSSMSAYKSFKEPNAFQSLSYRSGLGLLAEKITRGKGFVLPNLYFLLSTTGAASLAGMDHTSLLQVGAGALAAVFAKAYVESGVSKYGTKITSNGEVKNSVANLLSVSFQADQCSAIFRSKSL